MIIFFLVLLIIFVAFFLLSKKNIQFLLFRKLLKNKFLFSSPKIVALGGGTGLSTLLSGLKIYTRNITAIVAVTDEGGSSGRIRQEWGMLPPGDIRNCIVALAENDNSLNRLLNYRFDRGELNGHSLGNLILLASTEMFGDFYLAVKELNKLLAIRGQVLPVSTESLTLKGEINSNSLETISGELEISKNGSNLTKLWIEPISAKPIPETIQAVNDADILVMGPGSLFTSILPNLLMKDLALTIRASKAPIVYVANLLTQPKETEGMNIVAHVDWIVGILRRVPDYILVNHTMIPEDVFQSYKKHGSEALYLSEKEEKYLTSLGSKVIYGNFLAMNKDGHIRHNIQNLSKHIIEIANKNMNKGNN